MEVNERGLLVGAAVTLTQLNKKLKELIHELPGIFHARSFVASA